MINEIEDRLGVPIAEIVAWTRAFVRHPSPQTERFEQEPQVQSFIGEQVVPLLQKLALPWRRDAMGNLLVELGPERADRSLMLMAYAMTHPANRMNDPFAGELIEGTNTTYVRGRGVSEQKGALAAALAAVKSARDRLPLQGRLVFALSAAGETGRHDAAIRICDALGFAPKLEVIAIGTTGRVALANKGRIDVIVTVRGKAAHSSMPWTGVNAIEGARRVLDRVMSLDVGANEHPALGKATLTPTSARSWPDAPGPPGTKSGWCSTAACCPATTRRQPLPPSPRRQRSASPGKFMPSSAPSCIRPRSLPTENSCARPLPDAGAWACPRRRPSTVMAPSMPAFCARGAEAAMWGPGAMEQWHSDDEHIAVWILPPARSPTAA